MGFDAKRRRLYNHRAKNLKKLMLASPMRCVNSGEFFDSLQLKTDLSTNIKISRGSRGVEALRKSGLTFRPGIWYNINNWNATCGSRLQRRKGRVLGPKQNLLLFVE